MDLDEPLRAKALRLNKEELWPRHNDSLHLTHNQHKGYYQTVAQSIEEEGFGYTEECWISDEQKQKAIDTNDCWFIQWYPDTPVGFYVLSGCDLDAVLEAARKTQEEEDGATAQAKRS